MAASGLPETDTGTVRRRNCSGRAPWKAIYRGLIYSVGLVDGVCRGSPRNTWGVIEETNELLACMRSPTLNTARVPLLAPPPPPPACLFYSQPCRNVVPAEGVASGIMRKVNEKSNDENLHCFGSFREGIQKHGPWSSCRLAQ